jgi:MYXO-CTERM domain-containing protein
MRTQRSRRFALVSLTFLVAALVAPRAAHAEADTFGVGNGHDGAYVAAAADEVINAYAPLTADAAKSATSITIGTTLGAATGFAAGDLVMLWRATGVPDMDAASGSQATLDLNAAAMGAVGRFEFARIAAGGVTATTLTFTKPLTQGFTKDLTQVVSVPEYTTMTVAAGTGPAALAWQTAGTGFAGGIVAFLANGVATIDGHVSADARGFRGGALDTNLDPLIINCPKGDGKQVDGFAAKGEGVVAAEFGGVTHGGRGNRANGAGGGNCAENGGGGGGNAGVGGNGGNSIVATNAGGLGGSKLDYSLLARLDMGGGGGAGEQKNGVGSGGGAGGGVVFARVDSLAGAGQITADGATATNAGIAANLESDGAGGGGAGGSILIRAVGNVTCAAAQTKGGDGGKTAVVNIGTFGPGGGGSGGRVLIQAKESAGCPVVVAPGAAGAAGAGGANGATGGAAGASQPLPAPGGNFCFSNPASNPQCTGTTAPVCDPATGFCNGCTGPFGGDSPLACAVAVDPVCALAGPNKGACSPCNGDFGTATTSACQLTGAPYCNLTGATVGSCGTCTSNADCTGAGHGGTLCNVPSGACGTPCTDDTQCKTTEWCAGSPGICIPKTLNGEHVPMQTPIDGNCTVANGMRVCLSTACEMDDDLCGLKNGSPCMGKDVECRSTICFTGDSLCGKPTGEPCTMAGECRSAMCVAGVCSGCTSDDNCGTDKVCDKDRAMCVPGCREVSGKSNCIAPKQCSKQDGTIGECVEVSDAGAEGGDGGADGGLAFNDAGSIQGGGCACRTTMPISGSPFALVAAALGALLVAKRRRDRNNSEKEADRAANDKERG